MHDLRPKAARTLTLPWHYDTLPTTATGSQLEVDMLGIVLCGLHTVVQSFNQIEKSTVTTLALYYFGTGGTERKYPYVLSISTELCSATVDGR